jgi:hypothetical protein
MFAAVLALINQGKIINDGKDANWTKICRYEYIGFNKSKIEFCPRNANRQIPFELLFSIDSQFVHLRLTQCSNESVEVDLATYFVGVNQLTSNYFKMNSVKNIEKNDDIIEIRLLKDASVTDYEIGLKIDFIIRNHIVIVSVLYQNIIHIPKIIVNTEVISNENILNSNENLLTLLKVDRSICCPVDDEYFEPNYVPHEFDDYDNDPEFTVSEPDWWNVYYE